MHASSRPTCDRKASLTEMHAELPGLRSFCEAPAAQWETRLSAAGILCGMIRDVDRSRSRRPHSKRGDLKLDLEVCLVCPTRERVEIVNAGFLFSEDRLRRHLAAAAARRAQR